MTSDIAAGYERFAEMEARGRSPLYEALARHVAESRQAQAFLAGLPADRQQPNLLFAATRLVAGTPRDARDFADMLAHRGGEIAAVMRARTTQTNEPGRCAVLVPALAQIDGPIALIEVGASAGLCLLPDRYGYDWGCRTLSPTRESAAAVPRFPCAATEATPLPERLPEIVWRSGLDLNPLDVNDDRDRAWLETLVWPEDTPRRDRLRAALALARADPPRVHRGDLRHDLRRLIDAAPPDATVVVCHTAVLSYVRSTGDRARFTREMRTSDAVWLCNEAPRVFPDIAAAAGAPPSNGLFLLSRNAEPLAWTGPHGQSIQWLAGGTCG